MKRSASPFASAVVCFEVAPMGDKLAAYDPATLADAMERLLDNEERRERRSASKHNRVARHVCQAAAQVEAGLRTGSRLREERKPHASGEAFGRVPSRDSGTVSSLADAVRNSAT